MGSAEPNRDPENALPVAAGRRCDPYCKDMADDGPLDTIPRFDDVEVHARNPQA